MKPAFYRTLCMIFFGLATQLPSLHSQTLHIYYNVFTDSVRYEQNDKPVSRPRLRKGGTVYVHLTEYNPYLYTATVTIHNNPGQFLTAGTQSFSADASGATAMGNNSPVMGIFGTLSSPLFNMPLFSMGDEELSLASFAGGARSGAEEQMLRETDQMLQEAAATEARLRETGDQLSASGKALTIALLIEEQLDQIVYNPKIPPSEIKRLCKEYFSAMFGPRLIDSLSLLTTLDWSQNSQLFRKQAKDWARTYQKWDNQITELEAQMTDVKGMDWNDAALRARLLDVDEAVQTAAQQREGFESISEAAKNCWTTSAPCERARLPTCTSVTPN